jgi:hypothetical protein
MKRNSLHMAMFSYTGGQASCLYEAQGPICCPSPVTRRPAVLELSQPYFVPIQSSHHNIKASVLQMGLIQF